MNDYENNIDINNRGMYIAGSLVKILPPVIYRRNMRVIPWILWL